MSYISVPKGSHFSIKNIPFGIFSSHNDSTPRPATAIGDFVLDLSVLAKEGAFSKIPGFDESTLRQVIIPYLFYINGSPH
jgi:fumarylacetoacetase